MPSYFLDTSALAKRYHKEIGSQYMDRILEEAGSRSLISNLSIVEAPPGRSRCSRDEGHFQSARKLLVLYGVAEGLRTLDALQLAVALDLQRAGQISVLVAADPCWFDPG